ncbi:methyltransferase [Catenulispora subtropica]|uniref:Methyltransferase small domain-containing protein n=1 Tax=Catenulispora subtropica TaxID=450798 RepID=A0ABN2T6R5_9ACTN
MTLEQRQEAGRRQAVRRGTGDDPMAAGAALRRAHGAVQGRPGEFALGGRTWTLLPGVFAPVHTMSTRLFTGWLPYPAGGSFLEIGSGAGVTAVTAALSGCAHVTAVDIAVAAVANTEVNAQRHGVAGRVRVLKGDLFDEIGPDERFDLIYWNSNVIDAPAEFEYLDELQWAFFDRDYAAHRRYLSQGPELLAPGGRMFLGFNTLGNRDRLLVMADELGLEVRTYRRQSGALSGIGVELSLLEITAG